MIIELILNALILTLNVIFGFLPIITTLPSINGFDIDSALVTGIGSMRSFFETFWILSVVFDGFLFLLGYYITKMFLRLLLGSRTPQ